MRGMRQAKQNGLRALGGLGYLMSAAASSAVFIAHSPVQVSLNMTTPCSSCLVRQLATTAVCFSTCVELIAHSWLQVSRKLTAPVSRYSLDKQVAVAGGMA